MKKYIFCLISVLLVASSISATIIHIPIDYPTIQQGIDASYEGDTVLVQPGTYVENINFNGHNIVLGSLFLTTGDTSYISQTVIDGDSLSHVVTIEQGQDSTAAIIGFVIRNGYAINGGGIYCISSDPIITRNFIIENVDSARGGGIYCEESNPIIEYNNISSNNGSGIFCHSHSNPLIKSNIFEGNSGGGIRCDGYSEPVIIYNLISSNTTPYLGGGINCGSYSSPQILYNVIIDNFTQSHGGGIHCWYSYAIIRSNIIMNNVSALGGGIRATFGNPIIENNLVAFNQSSTLGGGIYVNNNYPTIKNNTVYGNSAITAGGGLRTAYSSAKVTNCIFYNNTASDEPEISVSGSTPTITYTNVMGGYQGVGNIDVDPLFRDTANGDFHLMATYCGDPYDSPCIDAGDPNILDSLLDCSWGLGGLRSDMGAYGGGDSLITGILDNTPPVPAQFMFLQNYPNPFNAVTAIRFDLPESEDVTLKVYDILGRQIKTLIDNYLGAGKHSIPFDASNLSSGIYFARLHTDNATESVRMLLLR